MPGLSIHAVDVARGIVASGLRVRVDRLDGEVRVALADGAIGANGLLESSEIAGILQPGVYEVQFSIGDYLKAQHADMPATPFLDLVPFRFGVDSPQAHYHLPFKFTAWGFSCFRGGA